MSSSSRTHSTSMSGSGSTQPQPTQDSDARILWHLSPNPKFKPSDPNSLPYTFRAIGTPDGREEVLPKATSVMNSMLRDYRGDGSNVPLKSFMGERAIDAINAGLDQPGERERVSNHQVVKPGPYSSYETRRTWDDFTRRCKDTKQAFSKAEMDRIPTEQPSMPEKEAGEQTVYINWTEQQMGTEGPRPPLATGDTQDRTYTLRVVTTPNLLDEAERVTLTRHVTEEVKQACDGMTGLSRLLFGGQAWREHKAKELTREYLQSRGLKWVTVETIRDPSRTSGMPVSDPTWTQFDSACKKSGQIISEKHPLVPHDRWEMWQSRLLDVYDTFVPKFVKDWITQASEACATHTNAGKRRFGEEERPVNEESVCSGDK